MQKGNLDSVKADEHGKIKKETVDLEGVSVTRVTFDVGAKWSTDLKGYAGTNSCQLPHVGLVLSGTLRVVMDDGSQQDFSKNDVMLLPPGHDAWSVGNEPCVFVEFSRGNDYYTGDHGHRWVAETGRYQPARQIDDTLRDPSRSERLTAGELKMTRSRIHFTRGRFVRQAR